MASPAVRLFFGWSDWRLSEEYGAVKGLSFFWHRVFAGMLFGSVALITDGLHMSTPSIPEPHEFRVELKIPGGNYEVAFEEHENSEVDARDHNMRAAFVHVLADAAVSVLVIGGLTLAWL